MANRTRSIATLAVLALVLGEPSGCGNDTPQQPEPQPVTTVTFVVETAEDNQHTNRRVVYTITGVQQDGRPANVVDPERGEIRPGSVSGIETTPWRYDALLSPGVVAVSISVQFLGRLGETVRCRALIDGQEVERATKSITLVGSGGRGGTSVSCEVVIGP